MNKYPRRDLSQPRTAINPHGIVTLAGDEYDVLFKLQYEVESLRERLRWYDDHKRSDGSYDGSLFGDLATLAVSDTPKQSRTLSYSAKLRREGGMVASGKFKVSDIPE